MSDMITIGSATATATFAPADGGRLTSLVVDGAEVLVDDDADLGRGCYPMVPWAGRIDRGRFRFGDDDVQLPITMPPHAIHGTAHRSSWSLTASQSDSLAMRLDLTDPWPFGGHVVQRAAIADDRLRLELEVTAGVEAMPAMAGWHPWFRRTVSGGDESVELEFGPAKMYELDDHAIPTGALIEPPEGPWDNCFVELASEPRLTWPGRLTLDLSSTCSHWVIYTEPEHAVCVEPQTDAPDSFNRSPDVLAPGHSLVATFEISYAILGRDEGTEGRGPNE